MQSLNLEFNRPSHAHQQQSDLFKAVDTLASVTDQSYSHPIMEITPSGEPARQSVDRSLNAIGAMGMYCLILSSNRSSNAVSQAPK